MTLGILGPQPVVDAFRAAGVSVTVDPENAMVATARLIQKRIKENKDFPVLVVSTPERPMTDALIAVLRQKTSRLVVAGDDIELPARFGDLAAQLGVNIVSDEDSMIDVGGLTAAEDDDDWLTDDLFAEEPAVEPTSTLTSTEPEPEPVAPELEPNPVLDLPDVPAGWDSNVVAASPEPPAQPAAQAVPPASWGAQPQQSSPAPGQPPVATPQPQQQEPVPPAPQIASEQGWSIGDSTEATPSADFQDFFDARISAREDAPAYRPAAGIVIFCWAGGGGVGKSTYSRVLAQMAAEAGYRTVLFDANRGQADQAQYVLRGGANGYATIHLYATTGDIQAAITTADEANRIRNSDPVAFDSLFSPTAGAHDLRVHTPELYARALAELKSIYDIILVDTQTLDHDSSDLWDGFIRPAMSQDAWAVGTSDDSAPKTKSLAELSQKFASRGVNPMRMLNTVTLTDPSPDDGEILASRFAPHSTFVGVIAFDEAFGQLMATGARVVTDSPSVDPVLRQVMKRITGSPAFDPRPEEPRKRFQLFGRKNKRG